MIIFRQAASLTAAMILLAIPVSSMAQDIMEPNVHWGYASFFGTGWYQLGERQSAFILSVRPRVWSGETSWYEVDGRNPEFNLRTPFTIGVNDLDFDDIPGIVDRDNFATFSVGVNGDMDLPVTAQLSLRPHAQLSYGTVIDESDYAWSYRAGVKARYMFEAASFDWGLVGSIGLVGYDAGEGDDDRFTTAGLGVEFEHPVSWFGSGNSQHLLYWHVLYTDLVDRLEVRETTERFDEITNFWQAGFAFGKEDKPLQFWFLKFDRLGLAADFNSQGDLRGIKFVVRSIYEL